MTEINITPFTPINYPGNYFLGAYERYVGPYIHLEAPKTTPVQWAFNSPYGQTTSAPTPSTIPSEGILWPL